jgi:hypothetical protein
MLLARMKDNSSFGHFIYIQLMVRWTITKKVGHIRSYVEISSMVCLETSSPLGNHAPNAPKWFSSAIILELARDEKWLSKASATMCKYWRNTNRSR